MCVCANITQQIRLFLKRKVLAKKERGLMAQTEIMIEDRHDNDLERMSRTEQITNIYDMPLRSQSIDKVRSVMKR